MDAWGKSPGQEALEDARHLARHLAELERDLIYSDFPEMIRYRQGMKFVMDVPEGWVGSKLLDDLVHARITNTGWPTRGETVWECG